MLNQHLSFLKKGHPEVYWHCLAENCPKNCCSKQFDNGKALNFYNIHHDQVPLLPYEKNSIINLMGSDHIKIQIDGLYYINMAKRKNCPFFLAGKCGIQTIKPSLCKAYPLIQLDAHVGPIFDTKNCPGFEYGKENNIYMTNESYMNMLESFIELQQYRLEQLSLQLKMMRHSK